MNIQIFSKAQQAYGEFNNGEIIENKPIGFPREGGDLRPYSNLFYWANAIALQDSTIGLHPHQGFEIMSFVLEGRIRHFDTKLNNWKVLEAGDVQIIRAGNGISHAEHMEKGARMFQIWTDPDLAKSTKKEASYNDYAKSQFPKISKDNFLKTVYIGTNSPFYLDTPGIEIYRINFQKADHLLPLSTKKYLSIYVLNGNFTFSEKNVKEDDFILISDTEDLQFSGYGELFIIASEKQLSYKTYGELVAGR